MKDSPKIFARGRHLNEAAPELLRGHLENRRIESAILLADQ